MADVSPHDLDAERHVLGAFLVDQDAVHLAASILGEQTTVFFKASHQLIYAAALRMANKGDPIDLYTITDSLKRAGDLEKIGGVRALYDIQEGVPTSANIEYYANIVREMATRRELIQAGSEIVSRAGRVEVEIEEVLDQSQRFLFDIYRGETNGFIEIDQSLQEAMTRIEWIYNNSSKLIGTPTGLPELDQIIYGLNRSDLIIVAARPSMGKSSFAHNLALNVSLLQTEEEEEPPAVALFTTEMPADQIVMRMLATVGEINMSRMRTGELSGEELKRISEAAQEIERAQIYISNTPGLTLMDIRSESRRLKIRRPNLGLVIVDYLQQLQSGSRQHQSREQEISEYSRSLKTLARELDVPVIALSQLNRNVENRPDKRPQLADLRESGAIEQDADIVLFLYRDDYYNPEDSDVPGEVEVIVRKHRNGPLGTANLAFDSASLRFSPLEYRDSAFE
ncbi:MAG: replicative DNA helicase [Candidatus Poribacteria bacterium]|nr:replicative DNA helicase [Candidatus Poribacteria bacterium]